MKASAFPDTVPGEGVQPNLFTFLFPRQVSELLRNTAAALSATQSRAQTLAASLNATAHSTLSSVGLPASVEIANASLTGDP